MFFDVNCITSTSAQLSSTLTISQHNFQYQIMELLPILSSFTANSRLNPWEHPEAQLITLKQLSQNLNFLEKQYHLRSKSNSKLSKRIQSNFSSIPVNTTQEKENKSLLSILPRRRKKGRSISVIKERRPNQYPNENPLLRTQKIKKGQEFREIRQLLPFQGLEQQIFLPKNRMTTISKAVNLCRLRTKTNSKLTIYTNEQSKKCNQKSIPSLLSTFQKMKLL